jgi:hypothetical protein
VSHASRKNTPIAKVGWSRADVGVAKVISKYGGSVLEIFLNKLELVNNEDLRKEV